MSTYEPLSIFLSFASDVEEEVDRAETVVRSINKRSRAPLGISLESTTWREMSPDTPPPPRTIQDDINEKVRECNMFVLVLNRRYGSTEAGETKSNLEREVDIALEQLERLRKITFLAYFCRLPDNIDPGPQERGVIEFRERLRNRGIRYREYSTPTEFQDSFTHDLYETLLKFRFSTQKHKALRSLWALGETDRPMYPQLAIVYPPVDREFLRAERPDRFWLQRLMPHIVFEDHKCLQKIEKTLRLINYRRYRICATVDVPTEINFMNRLWICCPRNARALAELEKYSGQGFGVAQFRFTPAYPGKEARIHWRHPKARGSYLRIDSPLRKYLQQQRAETTGGPWKASMGQIVAKDFAVLARFTDVREKETVSSAALKEFFIGGIRGLGTWGAGWFIDRRYSAFRDYDEDEAIQILLEVTYRNGRVFEVTDVSNEEESYFRRENSVRHIRRVIGQFGQR